MIKQGIDFKIFKAYDIRGIYPKELNKEAALAIGRALAKKTKAGQVMIGRDMRNGGLALKKNLIRGLAQGGVKEIIDVGLVPIDAIYFGVGVLKYEAGVMITASHNPKEYNGFKMVRRGKREMEWIDGGSMAKIVARGHDQERVEREVKMKVLKKDIYSAYIKHVLSFVETRNIGKLKVVVDAGNGMAGMVVPKLAKYLPIQVVPLNFKLDGNFPAHPSNPLLAESQVQIVQKVKQTKADCGVIFDGDTDRLFFVDEKGRFIRADITLLLLARRFLEREPGAGIAYNLICSRVVPEKIKEWGGRPIRTPVGFVNVAAGAKKNGGIMGGEVSAHYSFRDNVYADSGFIAFVMLLELLTQAKQPLSRMVDPFYKYKKLPEINVIFADRGEIIRRIKDIKNKYAKYKQDDLDGVTVDNWDNGGWWFNARPSNTEPLLRVTFEVKDSKVLGKIKKELLVLIKK